MYFLSKINTRKHKWSKRSILAGILMLFAVSATSVFLFKIVFAAPTEPVPSIELTSQHVSYANSEAGSWKVNKMAGWTARDKARIVIDVDTKMHYADKRTDILLVVDRSSPDDDVDKTQRYREALTFFTNKVLDEDNERRVALVTFDYDYHVKTGFTSDREAIISQINDISVDNIGNNYYQALNGAEMVLRSYAKEEDRDVIILFLTDGAPDEEDYFQNAEYRYIKTIYPYVTINAVQYGMGSEINDNIISISDNQYSANKATIKDTLFDASVIPRYYSEFILTDYIDSQYFTLAESNSINTNKGTYRIESEGDAPKIIWDLSGILRSGESAFLEINLELKPEYSSVPILFPTNRKTTITSSIRELLGENVMTESTPVLKADYKIKYITNTPEGCELTSAPVERTQFIFDVVEVIEATPTCPGYRFVGFKPNSRLKKINDDYFIMPSNDVIFIATWAKVGISKTMDGTVSMIRRLYREIENKAKKEDGSYNLDSSINFNNDKSYGHASGTYTMASTIEDEYPIHFFRGNVSDNNVIFADICWQAVRTTSTGGVKLIYNGEKDENNQCGNLRGTHEGYGKISSYGLSSNYYYGTDYTYDSSAGTFSLAGNKTLARMSDSTASSLIGQYTCMKATENATCSTVYYVDSRNGTSSAFLIPINSTTPYNTIGTQLYNRNTESPSYVGYMYGNNPESHTISYTGSVFATGQAVISNTSISTDFWYADDIIYNPDGSGHYKLVNPYQIDSDTNLSSLVGKYTFRNISQNYSYSSVYYIAAVNDAGTMMYYLHLKQGEQLEDVDVSYNISSNIAENEDGSYTMIDPITVKTSEWPTRYQDFTGKFICDYSSDNKCDKVRFMTLAGISVYRYVSNEKLTLAKARDGYNLLDAITINRYQISQDPTAYSEYKYTCGNTDTTCTPENLIMITSFNNEGYLYRRNLLLSEDIAWNGNQYILSGQVGIEYLNDLDIISTHHYVCETPGQTTCTRVTYIDYTSSGSTNGLRLSGITLSDGLTMPQAIENMFNNDNDSTAKRTIDVWYARTLSDYAEYIEDTPYCNDRSVRSLGSWNPQGGRTNEYMYFETYYRDWANGGYNVVLDCSNRDAFTVGAINGNGKLTYPVGMLSMDEVVLAGSGDRGVTDGRYLDSDGSTLTMTPVYYGGSAYIFHFGHGYGYGGVSGDHYLRPVISVMPGIIITTGDGTAEDPWVLE